MNNLIEISNIYPNNLRKNTIHASQRHLISVLRNQAYEICRTQLPHEYIRWAFNKFKGGFIYYRGNEPVAFCIWKISEQMSIRTLEKYNEMYIYLICGKQLDYKILPRMLDDIIHLCRKSNVKYIALVPSNDFLKEYYIKNGFVEIPPIAEGHDHKLVLDVSQSRIATSKRRNRTRKIKRSFIMKDNMNNVNANANMNSS